MEGLPKLADFGIAKAKSGEAGTIDQGTFGYQAPECALGIYMGQTDVWSWAATLYEMLAGDLPGENPSKWFEERFFKIATLGKELEGYLRECLEHDYEKRLAAKPALVKLAGLMEANNIAYPFELPTDEDFEELPDEQKHETTKIYSLGNVGGGAVGGVGLGDGNGEFD